MTPLRVGFAGTPAFAAEALAAILAAGHAVPVVLSQPDRPQGRGLRLAASPVKELALRHALPVLQPPTLAAASAADDLELLAGSEELEMIENLEFYAWLEQQSLDG